jgi:hypothetical protein
MKRSDFFNYIIVYNHLLLYHCKIKEKIEYMNQIKELLTKKEQSKLGLLKNGKSFNIINAYVYNRY